MSFFSAEIISLIRDQALTAEANMGLSADILSYIYQKSLLKLFVPTALNGAATSLPDAVRIFEEASAVDGSFGWLLAIGSGGGYFASMFDKEASQQLFTPDNAVVAGSGHASGTAMKIKDGYTVSGRWKYASGADFATIFTANCQLDDGTIKSFIFTPDQVTVTRDWGAYGLKATGSHTISIQNVFAPFHMTFDIEHGRRNYPDLIFSYPFLQFAEASFAGVNIGICSQFIELALEAAKQYLHSGETSRYKFVHDLILRQQSILKKDTDQFYQALDYSWQILADKKAVNDISMNEVSRYAKCVTATALLCAQAIYPYLGLQAAMEQSSLNRCWRDLHTASQHLLLKSFE